ncbi:hypothetical protein BS78_02G257600 [Paspalum vaginatum]|nr:hypothetical protein BS78_02G257600 [Paspalum vaginatum]
MAHHNTNSCASRHATNTTAFPRPPAPPQPPLLPLPVQASPQYSFQPVNRPAPRCHFAEPGPNEPASAPITVAAPSKKRAAPATGLEEALHWTETEDSLYSVSPPPSSVPIPTSLLLTVTAARTTQAPTPCAVEVAAGVDVGATDELRRLLRL